MFAPALDIVDDVTSAAERVLESAFRASVAARGSFVLVLSGGSTPLALYRALAERSDLPWDRLTVLWGDERYVPHDHPDSNAGQALRAWLSRVPVPPEQVHPWPHLATPEASAEAYAVTVRDVLHRHGAFDLTLLGLGEDGHVASLFPGTGAALRTGTTLALPPHGGHPRLSLTAEVLSTSRIVALLVAGERKRAALERTLAGEGDLDHHPARAVGARERLLIITDVRGLARP